MKDGLFSRIGNVSEQEQFKRMTEAPVPGLILRLAVPTVVSMLVSALYNMADTFFVSQLGTSASGAVGIVFSLMAIIQAVGFTLGSGSGGLVSRKLGAKEHELANTYASSAFFAALAFGLVLTVCGLHFLDPLMRGLGATETILPYARDYGRYILLAAPFMCAAFVLNVNLRYQGKAALSMIGLATGGLVNIALDPIFIFVFKLGAGGAAMATMLSQCVSFCILLSMFLKKRSLAELSPRWVSFRPSVYLDIIKNGFPSLCRQGLSSLSAVLLNTAASVYGDAAIAAMAIVGRVYLFASYLGLGIGQGAQPVYGYNYGARKFGRVRQTYQFSVACATACVGAAAIASIVLAPQIVALFRRDDALVIEIGSLALRLAGVALLTTSFTTGSTMLLQATGQSAAASLLSCCRQGIFFLPLILLLPGTLGVLGIQTAQPLADLLTAAASVPFVVVFYRKMKRMEDEGMPPSGETPPPVPDAEG